ncbi:DUF2599 domain-containing protein [Ornithinimicrobium panacihumi]|uniref:DUF2599 domain-containing protein n=1 Tax=Ornithinimicrobium panacihumi TaxID=2008449 RepID=UPI003F8C55A7
MLSATWVERTDGASLRIEPGDALRRCGGPLSPATESPPGWESVLGLVPEADSPGMREQYACHLRFASGKEVWHLEPWRPVVDERQLVADRCNPGAPDPDLAP